MLQFRHIEAYRFPIGLYKMAYRLFCKGDAIKIKTTHMYSPCAPFIFSVVMHLFVPFLKCFLVS